MAVCIRGAITADKNEREEILSKTKEMLLAIIEKNNLNLEEITSVLFTWHLCYIYIITFLHHTPAISIAKNTFSTTINV